MGDWSVDAGSDLPPAFFFFFRRMKKSARRPMPMAATPPTTPPTMAPTGVLLPPLSPPPPPPPPVWVADAEVPVTASVAVGPGTEALVGIEVESVWTKLEYTLTSVSPL
jgi:hypothetical protein